MIVPPKIQKDKLDFLGFASMPKLQIKGPRRSSSIHLLPYHMESVPSQHLSRSLQEDGKKRCLIANDELLQLSILEFSFKNFGFIVETAQNGFEAFEIVQKNFY